MRYQSYWKISLNHNSKKDKNKYSVNEVLEKFNQSLRIPIIRKK